MMTVCSCDKYTTHRLDQLLSGMYIIISSISKLMTSDLLQTTSRGHVPRAVFPGLYGDQIRDSPNNLQGANWPVCITATTRARL
jgi:hypothetical protein